MHKITIAVLTVLLAGHASSQSLLAPTPPMGWNSWDSFGTTVTEDEVKANADYMSAKLAKYGWQYIVVDIQWSETNPKTHGYRPNAELAMDSYGRLMPAPNRFPSAAEGRGFKPLAEYIHSKGLRFGIHVMRGIPRRAVDANLPVFEAKVKAGEIADKQSVCRWNSDMYGVDVSREGGQAYYDSVARLYASWGVDFVKADDMFAFGPNGDHSREIEALSKALKATGRDIVLSLSPGTHDIFQAAFIGSQAQMWRISNDLWDRWIDVKRQFPNLANWNPYMKSGNWPDADMLPLGHIGIRAERGEPRMSLLTHDEQRTLMTLWSIARSPLMFGGHLPDSDPFTFGLITNEEVLSANQKSTANKPLFSKGNQVAWVADVSGSKAKYVAVFNAGDTGDEAIRINWADLGLAGSCAVRDLWEKRDLAEAADGKAFNIGPHSAALYRITPK